MKAIENDKEFLDVIFNLFVKSTILPPLLTRFDIFEMYYELDEYLEREKMKKLKEEFEIK